MEHDRLNPVELAPDLYKAILSVEREVRRNVDARLLHLVKLRASMVNGCAFCIDMHSEEGLADGETPARLFALAAWRETPAFTDAERAALALADALTTLGEHGVPDDVWADASAHFDDKTLVHLVGAIGVINLWNRLSIALRSTPASARAA
jgi:AhpD family alkylhydroperoxidase